MEPIAIVGIGCRLPGGIVDADTYWRLLMDGVDAIRNVPAERWPHERFLHPDPTRPRRTSQAQGGFIDQVDQFDASFFHLSPREAKAMDPQQRLLLEVAWEAVEDAGLPVDRLSGTRTGVFIGVSSPEYLHMQHLDSMQAHSMTGGALSITANRISFSMNLTGPSMVVDTACSSGLVALHLGCQSLWRGESSMALVGAVNLLLTPVAYIGFSRLSVLSPTSRCHAFGAGADGYVRSEGAGVVCLKPLSQARADGDRIYATVERTGTNQDGGNQGLTIPNARAQAQLLREVYQDLPVDRLHYVEAHGTGTLVGDPIEAQALGEALGHPARTLKIGSVKSQIGHLESGAGIAGLIKAALIAWHRMVPASLHCTPLSPHIPFAALGLEVATTVEPLPGPGYIGVNSFGFGGSNAHAVLHTPPPPDAPLASPPGAYLVPLSAASGEALQALKQRYRTLSGPIDGISYAATMRRMHHPYREAVVVTSSGELGDALRTPNPPRPAGPPPRIAFVYNGQGSLWVGAGRSLMTQEPVFAAFIHRCSALVEAEVGWSLEHLLATGRAADLDRTALAQPLIFAIQAGVTHLLEGWGVVPEAVLGHSVGEVTAAYVSGSLSLEQAVRLICRRGKVMDCVASAGRMAAVTASAVQMAPFLSPAVGVAAINGPEAIVLSGPASAMEAVMAQVSEAGYGYSWLKVDYAYHSAQMDALQGPLATAVAGLTPGPTRIPMISTVTGALVQGSDLGPSYWAQNIRRPVLLSDAVACALRLGVDTLVEVGAHPVLGPALYDSGAHVLGTLRREQDGRAALLRTLAGLYRLGAPVVWTRPDRPGWADLPQYPWQRQRFWTQSALHDLAAGRPYALLGNPVNLGQSTWLRLLEPGDPPWLLDHRLRGEVLVSASVFVAIGLELAHSERPAGPWTVQDFIISDACFLAEGTKHQCLTTLHGGGRYDVATRLVDLSQPWTRHAEGRLGGDTGPPPHTLDLDQVRARCTRPGKDTNRRWLELSGLSYHGTYNCIEELWIGSGEAIAVLVAPVSSIDDDMSVIHPGLLDACFQTASAATREVLDMPKGCYLPSTIQSIRCWARVDGRVLCHVRLHASTRNSLTIDIGLYSESGEMLLEVKRYRCVLSGARRDTHDLQSSLYRIAWVEAPAPVVQSGLAGRWAVLSDGSAMATDLTVRLQAAGHTVVAGVEPDLAGLVYFSRGTVEDPAAALLPLVELSHGPVPRVWVVTRNAQPAGSTVVDAAQTPILGLTRVLAAEHPASVATLVDMEADTPDAAQLWLELHGADGDEVAWRGSIRYVQRLERWRTDGFPTHTAVHDDALWRLESDRPGALETLVWRGVKAAPALGPDEVKVEVACAGLNFSDVMRALDIYPTDVRQSPLGAEFAGVVLRVGAGVTNVRVGDRVMGVGPHSLASQVVTRASCVVALPAGLSLEDAATMPLVFLTACYALETLAQVQPGERVLIHAASGGVGLAAVQVARARGAEIYATAGSPDKRAYLRQLGLVHVYDSRTLEFADAIDGGVDVILNSLAGDAIGRGIGMLRPFGRFLELGKRDIYANSPLALSAFRHSLAFFAIDLEQVMGGRPELMARLLSRIVDGTFTPLPRQTWPFAGAVDAFRCLAQARHIGKVVLQAGPVDVMPLRLARYQPDPEGTYVVTGGQGGFAQDVIRRLRVRGARHIAIFTRSPRPHAEGRTFAVDVGDRASLAAGLAQVRAAMPPIKGIIHAAMELDDGVLAGMTRARLERALHAKMRGAWNLHLETAADALDCFVMFSSTAAIFGSGGQANYAAANAFLDGLAHQRQAMGLPGVSINWGPIGEVGYVSRTPSVAAWLQTHGSRLLSPPIALEGFEVFAGSDVAQVCVMDMDWERVRSAAVPPRLRSLGAATDPGERRPDVRRALQDAPAEQLHPLLYEALMQQVGRVTGTPPADLDGHRKLGDLGIDSLMSLELRNWTRSIFDLSLGGDDTVKSQSVSQLVDLLVRQLAGPAVALPPVDETPVTDEDVELMLAGLVGSE